MYSVNTHRTGEIDGIWGNVMNDDACVRGLELLRTEGRSLINITRCKVITAAIS